MECEITGWKMAFVSAAGSNLPGQPQPALTQHAPPQLPALRFYLFSSLRGDSILQRVPAVGGRCWLLGDGGPSAAPWWVWRLCAVSAIPVDPDKTRRPKKIPQTDFPRSLFTHLPVFTACFVPSAAAPQHIHLFSQTPRAGQGRFC